MPDVGNGPASVLANVDPVFARLEHGKRNVRRIDFVRIFIVQMPHSQDYRSLCQANLCGVVIEREESDSGLRAQADRGGTNVHFGARIFVSPQIVARNHGAVGHARYPVVFAGRPKRDGTL